MSFNNKLKKITKKMNKIMKFHFSSLNNHFRNLEYFFFQTNFYIRKLFINICHSTFFKKYKISFQHSFFFLQNINKNIFKCKNLLYG